MKRIIVFLCLLSLDNSYAQTNNDVINAKEVLRIESTLASDDMRGRRAGTPDIDRAASFIADEFKKAGLQPLKGNSFIQEFSMIRPKFISVNGEINGQELDPKNIMVITSQPHLQIDEKSGYEYQNISAGDNLFQKAQTYIHANKNLLVFVDTSLSKNFSRLVFFKRQMFKSNN